MSQLLVDGAGIAVVGISSVKDAIDAIFGETEVAVPKLEADVVAFATDYVDQHVGGAAGEFIKAALGFAGPVIAGAEATASNAILAALSVAQTRVDNDLAAVTAKLPTA